MSMFNELGGTITEEIWLLQAYHIETIEGENGRSITAGGSTPEDENLCFGWLWKRVALADG